MSMKLSMEQYVLKFYKVYINDDPELTMTYFKTMSNFTKACFCTYSSTRYQVSVYRTTGPLVFRELGSTANYFRGAGEQAHTFEDLGSTAKM